MATSKKKTGKASADKQVDHFTEAQKLLIIQWLAEGLTTKEMNARAAIQKPPFMLTPSEAYYYRVTWQVDVDAAKKIRYSEVMNAGFALQERRIEALNSLSMKIFEELSTKGKGNKLWLKMVKGIGSGPTYARIDYEEFNKAEVDALRSLLDDIALEVGGRIRRTDVTTKNRPISGLDPQLWKDLSDDELTILERAAEILERTSTDHPAARSSKK